MMGCAFLVKSVTEAERASAPVPADRSLAKMPGKLFCGKCLASFINWKKELMCVDWIHVLDGDVRRVFAKSGLIIKKLYLSSAEYHGALNVSRAWHSTGCVLREGRAYARDEFVAEKNLLKGFVLF